MSTTAVSASPEPGVMGLPRSFASPTPATSWRPSAASRAGGRRSIPRRYPRSSAAGATGPLGELTPRERILGKLNLPPSDADHRRRVLAVLAWLRENP